MAGLEPHGADLETIRWPDPETTLCPAWKRHQKPARNYSVVDRKTTQQPTQNHTVADPGTTQRPTGNGAVAGGSPPATA
ncbi:hypothetical protein, partial [Nonomuraea zeae]|uniref:hypothetical protein n=1 Tax=Nonomuraea zeae TaxID=1642303 RepID=UPI00362392B2